MKQLLHLKEVIKLRKGLLFTLKLLFDTFLIGIVFSVICELVFLAFAKILSIDIYLNAEVFMSILTASFLTFVFSKKNIFNQLFINGFSRKKIAKIKTMSCIVYGLVFFILFVVYEIFYAGLLTDSIYLDTILYLLVVYLAITFVVEFATFLDLIYKKISMKKGKGINKAFYKYAYSIVLILITYIYRLIYPVIYDYCTNIVLITILLLLVILKLMLSNMNKKWILSMDIRA